MKSSFKPPKPPLAKTGAAKRSVPPPIKKAKPAAPPPRRLPAKRQPDQPEKGDVGEFEPVNTLEDENLHHKGDEGLNRTPVDDPPEHVDPESNQQLSLLHTPVGVPVGQFDVNDFSWPQLKLAQRVGPLTERLGFTMGDWILIRSSGDPEDAEEASILWQEECEPFEITILRWKKGFVQQTAFASEEMSKFYDTAEQAIADGLIPFGGDDIGFVPYINAMVLIKQPEGVEGPLFTEEHEGVPYAVALWRITGVAYSRAAKKVNDQGRLRLKAGLHHGSFMMEARQEQGKINTYFVPVLKEGAMHDKAFIKFAERCAG